MRVLTLSLLTLLLFASCAPQEEAETVTDEDVDVIDAGPEIEKATAVLHPTEGNNTLGIVVFQMTEQGVQVEATVTGLEADSLHGFHIHEYGDCREPDGTSAGGHYNPDNEEHGAPDDDLRHMGDLGNIPANAQGVATTDFIDTELKLNGPNSIIGRGVIVHANEDDFVSQPSGAAGPRVACGVIGIANPDVVIKTDGILGL